MMASWELEAAATLSYDGILIFDFDVSCLEKGEFINNAVIDFYLKYLCRVWLTKDQRQRIQIFDSAFLNNIAEKVGNKTTCRMDILEKDFMVMPVLLEEHWFLVVLCYPRNTIAENFVPSQKPQILIFDSAKDYLNTKRSPFLRSFRSLVQHEIAVLLKESCKEVGNLSRKLPFKMVPTTQQDNDVDCGVFLMENVERFLHKNFELPAEIESKTLDPDCYAVTSEAKRENLKDLIRSLASSAVVHVFDE